MKKNKRLLCLLVAVVMVAALFAGCGKAIQQVTSTTNDKSTVKSDAAATVVTKPAEAKKLVVYSVPDFDTDDFYTAFEQKNNVKIEKILVSSDKFKEAFMVAINGGQQVDVGLINGQDVRSYSMKGLLTDLTNDVNYTDRFYEASVNTFKIGGKLYALPTGSMWLTGLYYNKDIFAKYNLQPPKTYEDVVNIQKVVSKDGIAAISVGAAAPYDLTNWYFVNFFQASGNKGIERTEDTLRGNAKFTDPDYVEAFAYIQKYAKDGLFQKGYMGADANTRLATFVSGKTAMFFTGNWDISAFIKAGMDVNKLGVVNWPLMKAGVKQELSGTAGGLATVIYSKSAPEMKELDLKLIDYITSDEMNVKENKKTNTTITVNKNVKIEGATALDQQIQSDCAPNVVLFLDWIWNPEVTKAMAEGIQSVMALKSTPEEVTAKVQKAYDDAVAKGYSFDAVK